jgi:hypothetical protein
MRSHIASAKVMKERKHILLQEGVEEMTRALDRIIKKV